MTPYNITRLNRDIRDVRDIKERPPSGETPIDSYSKFKARAIKN